MFAKEGEKLQSSQMWGSLSREAKLNFFAKTHSRLAEYFNLHNLRMHLQKEKMGNISHDCYLT